MLPLLSLWCKISFFSIFSRIINLRLYPLKFLHHPLMNVFCAVPALEMSRSTENRIFHVSTPSQCPEERHEFQMGVHSLLDFLNLKY